MNKKMRTSEVSVCVRKVVCTAGSRGALAASSCCAGGAECTLRLCSPAKSMRTSSCAPAVSVAPWRSCAAHLPVGVSPFLITGRSGVVPLSTVRTVVTHQGLCALRGLFRRVRRQRRRRAPARFAPVAAHGVCGASAVARCLHVSIRAQLAPRRLCACVSKRGEADAMGSSAPTGWIVPKLQQRVLALPFVARSEKLKSVLVHPAGPFTSEKPQPQPGAAWRAVRGARARLPTVVLPYPHFPPQSISGRRRPSG